MSCHSTHHFTANLTENWHREKLWVKHCLQWFVPVV